MMFLLFQLGGDRYALEGARVLEALPLVELRQIPQAPAGVAGLFDYHGQPVPAIDLSELTLGKPTRECLSTRILLINYPDEHGRLHPLGLIVEHATEVIRRERADFTEPGLKLSAAPFLGPVLMDGQGVIQLLHAGRLLPDRIRDALFLENAGATP